MRRLLLQRQPVVERPEVRLPRAAAGPEVRWPRAAAAARPVAEVQRGEPRAESLPRRPLHLLLPEVVVVATVVVALPQLL